MTSVVGGSAHAAPGAAQQGPLGSGLGSRAAAGPSRGDGGHAPADALPAEHTLLLRARVHEVQATLDRVHDVRRATAAHAFTAQAAEAAVVAAAVAESDAARAERGRGPPSASSPHGSSAADAREVLLQEHLELVAVGATLLALVFAAVLVLRDHPEAGVGRDQVIAPLFVSAPGDEGCRLLAGAITRMKKCGLTSPVVEKFAMSLERPGRLHDVMHAYMTAADGSMRPSSREGAWSRVWLMDQRELQKMFNRVRQVPLKLIDSSVLRVRFRVAPCDLLSGLVTPRHAHGEVVHQV